MPLAPFRPHPAWLTLFLAAVAAPSQAQDKGFQFNAGYQIQRDSNLFRLPSWLDPRLAIGQPTAADTLQVKNVGISFDQRYSLQNIRAEVSVVDYEYSRNSRYDLVATNYDVNWDWAFTPQLRGRVHGDRSETVNSFDDTSAQTTGANRRVRSNHGVDFNYELDGSWNVLGGVYRNEDRYDEDVVGADGYRQTSADGGLRHNFGSGSSLTGKLRHTSGRNIHATTLGNDSFRQNDLQLDLRWIFSGVTTASASLKRIDRSHPSAPAFDYSGFNGSASVQWRPTGKLQMSFSGSSDLSSYQSTTSTHARTDRLSVNALWMLSPFTTLRAGISESRLRLLGHPSGGSTNPRRDNTLETSVNASWAIDDHFTLTGGLVHRKRDSTLAIYDFSSNLLSVGLSANF